MRAQSPFQSAKRKAHYPLPHSAFDPDHLPRFIHEAYVSAHLRRDEMQVVCFTVRYIVVFRSV